MLNRQEGMSFMEVAMVMTIMSIISLIAMPSFSQLINNSQLRSERNALLQDIRVVRHKAITYRRPAYICALDKNEECGADASWNNGWMAYIDDNLNARFDASDVKILVTQKPAKRSKIEIILHARWKNIKFNAQGVLRRSGHFRVCNPEIEGKRRMQIIRMNNWGRLALEEDELSCT